MQGALRRGCQGLACSHRSQQRSRHQPVFGCSREPGALKSFCSAPLRRPLQSAPCFAHVCGLARPLKAARPRRCKPVSARSNSSPEVTDRLLAALPYLVPLFDGVQPFPCALFWLFAAAIVQGFSACLWLLSTSEPICSCVVPAIPGMQTEVCRSLCRLAIWEVPLPAVPVLLPGARAAGPADTALLLLPVCKVTNRSGRLLDYRNPTFTTLEL